jgi:hypothetical protein
MKTEIALVMRNKGSSTADGEVLENQGIAGPFKVHARLEIGDTRIGRLMWMLAMSSVGESLREWRPLSIAEHEMLSKLLIAQFPGSRELAIQAQNASAKTLDAEGSIALDPGTNAPVADVERRVPVEAEFEDADGVTIHVLLHVVDGLMNEMELYREDSGPILSDRVPTDWRILTL